MKRNPLRMIVSFIVVLILVLWGLYGFMQHIDPTHKLLFYPNVKNKDNNSTYIFPAFNQKDIFLEKKTINFKTLYPMLGNILNESDLREKYEFNHIIKVENNNGFEYSIFTNMDAPYAYINTDEYNRVINISSVYLSNAKMQDKYLRGMYIEEITRLQNYLNGIGDGKPKIEKSESPEFTQYISYKTNDFIKYHNIKTPLIYKLQIQSTGIINDLSVLANSNINNPVDITISIGIEK